jgi:hypothetical protein
LETVLDVKQFIKRKVSVKDLLELFLLARFGPDFFWLTKVLANNVSPIYIPPQPYFTLLVPHGSDIE